MLAAHRGTADAAGTDWQSAVYRKIEEEVKLDRGLTIGRMVKLGRVSRSGYYRFTGSGQRRKDADMNLRDAIQRIALQWPSYGRPRITAELRRQGWKINPKRVYRLRREDNLLCVRRRKFIATTDSGHKRKVIRIWRARWWSPVLISCGWPISRTFFCGQEFVYLAVVLDACSRRVIGWALDRTLEDELTLAALRMALSRRIVAPELVHHSDRGSQYASEDYTDLLKAHEIVISMSRKANPWDNAACESFM